jgi:signal transduction histidine kinase
MPTPPRRTAMPVSPLTRRRPAAGRAAAAWLGAVSISPAWAAAGETSPGLWILIALGAALIGAVAGVATAVALQAGRPRREQVELRRALAACCDWWWSTDDALRVTHAEAAGRAAPAQDLRALLGRPPWQPDPKVRSGAPAALSEAIGRQLPFQDVELPMPSEQQPQRVLRLSGSPLFSPAGRFAGYAGVASLRPEPAPGGDASASLRARVRQLEAESAGRAQRHEQAVRDLDSFAHSVSHDLRAPLRVIDGFAQIVLEDYGEQIDALGREHLKRIVTAGARMNSMIDTLLSMSRMTAHDLRCERVDLSQAAHQLADELGRQEPGRRVDVVVAPGLAADGDPTLLHLVLQNLLGNAFKFSSRTPSARVEFGRQADTDHAFYVRDNGAGFDMRFADRLFGVFQRLHSQSEFAGTGVGLATVQRIVRRHGGRIWAESEPGRGATFYFTLWEQGAPPG